MSWKIGKPKDPEIDALFKNALGSAVKKGILMFCSSGDSGDLEYGDSYPCALYTDKIFKIGAATALGKPRTETPRPQLLDYILPGHEVLERKPKGVKSDSHTGSSVATALAAGLAAMILHCVKVGAIYTHWKDVAESSKDSVNITVKNFMASRRNEEAVRHMRVAFKRFNSDDSHNQKYIEVRRLLDDPNIFNRWTSLSVTDQMIAIAQIGQEFVDARPKVGQDSMGSRSNSRVVLHE